MRGEFAYVAGMTDGIKRDYLLRARDGLDDCDNSATDVQMKHRTALRSLGPQPLSYTLTQVHTGTRAPAQYSYK